MKHALLFKQNDNCLLTTNNGSIVKRKVASFADKKLKKCFVILFGNKVGYLIFNLCVMCIVIILAE